MKPAIRLAAGATLALGTALGVAALSRVPYEPPGAQGSVLRLSWRVPGVRVRDCRRLSAREVAALPIHMRRTEICEGRVLPYHLRVELDGRVVLDGTIRPAGAREDRPLFVFHELPLQPGTHRLVVRFHREGGNTMRRQPPELRRPALGPAGATPARLDLARTLTVDRGAVILITYDADLRELTTRGQER